ncbi:hypothetical protein Tco_0517133, partial [Tanacetum coccineum]
GCGIAEYAVVIAYWYLVYAISDDGSHLGQTITFAAMAGQMITFAAMAGQIITFAAMAGCDSQQINTAVAEAVLASLQNYPVGEAYPPQGYNPLAVASPPPVPAHAPVHSLAPVLVQAYGDQYDNRCYKQASGLKASDGQFTWHKESAYLEIEHLFHELL